MSVGLTPGVWGLRALSTCRQLSRCSAPLRDLGHGRTFAVARGMRPLLLLTLLASFLLGACASEEGLPDPAEKDYGHRLDRASNDLCHAQLDDWMFACVEDSYDGESIKPAVVYCTNTAVDGARKEGACQGEGQECLVKLDANASECGKAIGEEIAPRQPNSACDEALDGWMVTCIESNAHEGLATARDFCQAIAEEGDMLQLDGVCAAGDEGCVDQMSQNAEACASAIAVELAR